MFKNKETFKEAFLDKLYSIYGKSIEESSNLDKYMALVNIAREHINKNMALSNKKYLKKNVKQVYYFSMEFLLGRILNNYLSYLGVREIAKEGLLELGIDIDEIERTEPDPGLGNGGLGRLAACFLDSMACLGIAGHGCGIRYKYGFFEQKIVNGYQVELPDNWLREDNAWEIRKSDKSVIVKFGGNVITNETENGLKFIHENYEQILAIPYDMPIVGRQNNTVNTLRLWSAEPIDNELDFKFFNKGDHIKAIEYRYSIKAITEVLYPDDSNYKNIVLRLKQEYFFVSAGLQSIIRRFKIKNGPLEMLPELVSIHINDTHPSLAIPEMMRILIDDEGLDWDSAWDLTSSTISYTNHTILPEALEKWPVDIMRTLLPRIYMIINEINERFCAKMWNKFPGDWDRIASLSIIADNYVRMDNLAVIGSKSVNGVAKVHTEILKSNILKNFYDIFPEKFNNKTNGITHRRWLLNSNQGLSSLITDAIGDGWKSHPSKLIELSEKSIYQDSSFIEKFNQIKKENKKRLIKHINRNSQIKIDENSIFDSQVKRIHGYKRQLLNILHVMHLYNRIIDEPSFDLYPRTFIFAGKAAPSYHFAKKIIKLITSVGQVVNNDPLVKDRIKVVFLENYNVSLAEMIFPASDVSEQLSTAGKEASGTGNMKFMMNGAVTLGTMDGANIEIFDEVGDDNIFIFGLSVDEVFGFYNNGGYSSYDVYNKDSRIKKVIDQLTSDSYFKMSVNEFWDIRNLLLQFNDEYFVLKDFDSYADAHLEVDKSFRDTKKWTKKAILNVAHSGKFSSDETILKYAKQIWDAV